VPLLRAVFFDVDDTLVDFGTAARNALPAVLGVGVDYGLWTSLNHYARFTSGEWDFDTMRTTRMADFLTMIGRPEDAARAAELEAARMERLVAGYRLHPDVAACLDLLRERGLLLGVITNNDSNHQRAKLHNLGLAEAFDAVVISGEVGIAKPAPEIFALACERLEVEPAEAVHVGDMLDVDALGAHNAGLRGIWLDRLGRAAGEYPVSVLRGLDELDALVG
jgi:putative hydrolase of the HAD superfamily